MVSDKKLQLSESAIYSHLWVSYNSPIKMIYCLIILQESAPNKKNFEADL